MKKPKIPQPPNSFVVALDVEKYDHASMFLFMLLTMEGLLDEKIAKLRCTHQGSFETVELYFFEECVILPNPA